MRSITIFFIFLVTTVYASAQQGTLRGTIIDAETGEPLIGASVVVTNTTNGTISDFDGNYTLKLAPGNYSITVSYISYETQTFTDVEVNAGETITLNANLRVATTDLEEVVVTARSRQQTESAMQVMQKKSAIVMDGISAQHISRLGDSDAAGALKRVTGVTVQDGKYVCIRGLSDRYMTITLNGAIIPGLDPNFNTVQMDLFPSNVIENMVVSKTYTPDQPSFTGGLVNIQTKDFPTRLTINASASTGINSQAHFHDDFLTYNTGENDWLGFDDGTREVPAQLKDKALTEPVTVISEPEISYNESKHFNKELDNEYRTAPLNQGYSFSLGNQFDFSNERALGFIAALSYSSKSTYFEGGKNSDLDAANDQVVEYSETLTENMGSQDVIWSALLSSSLKINNNNRIRLTYLRNQNGTSTSRSLAGRTMKSDIYDMEKTSLEYLERSLTAYQMSGKHVVPALNNLSMEWQTSYTHSIQNEPDLRFFINEVITLNEGQDTIYEVRSNRKPERRYRHMWEYNWHSRLDFTAPVNLGDKNLALKFGASYLKKFRNSEDDRYTIEVIGTTPTDAFRVSGHPSDFVLDPNLFGYESQLRGTYYANDLYTNQYYSYEGEDEIPSGYLMADFPLFDKLRLVGGVRYEQTSMYISNQIDTTEFNRASHLKAARNSKADTTFKYLLPAINITYQVNNNMNIRAAYSSSVSRPSFRERAPFDYYEFTTGYIYAGNPDLEIAFANSVDLRWEYFFAPGELISVSGFFKEIIGPIEAFKSSSTGDLIQYRNGRPVTLFGTEFEFRKNLAFIGLEDFEFGTNITLIKSETKVDSARLADARKVVTDFPSTRKAFGQPPYIVNAYLNYHNSNLGLDANVGFNVEGEKIVIISKWQTPDVHQQPYPALNFNISKDILKNFSLKFSAKNILNPEYAHSIDLAGETYYYRRYTIGREFSLSLSYNFEK